MVAVMSVSTVSAKAGETTDPAAPANEGHYIWVPDSLTGRVMNILSGSPGFDEKVTFRGDTIPMVLKSRNFGRFDRGLTNYLFIPKGMWTVGLTASYGEFSTSDLEMLDMLSDADLEGHTFSLHPYVAYFLRNNISLGLKLGYSSSRGSIDSVNLDIDDDMNFSLHDIMYRSKIYSVAVAFRQYFGITRNGRFGVFNEVDLGFSSGHTDFTRPYNNELKNTHTDVGKLELGFMPGVNIFIIENISFNLSLGVFGVQLRKEKQTVDGEPMGERFTSGADFRFNIFNINFGIEAHF